MQDNREIETSYRKAMEATVTYKVGKLVVDARHSLRNMLLLPYQLFRLAQQYRNIECQSYAAAEKPLNDQATPDISISSDALGLIAEHGQDIEGLYKAAQNISADGKQLNRLLRVCANITSASDALLASSILSRLSNLEHDASAQKELAFILYESGDLSKASALLDQSEIRVLMSPQERIRAKRIISEANILANGIEIPPIVERRSFACNRIMYVCHTSFPHHNNGYAVRTHNVALAIKELGHDIECVSRPGYPWDRKDALDVNQAEEISEIDGLKYYRYQSTNVSTLPLDEYVEQAATTLYQHIIDRKISVVMAASNYVNAMPALIAARRANVKFIYDVRGLWEYSYCSKVKNWEYSERFQLARRLETLLCEHGNSVIAISSALKEKLISRGVKAEKITVALNAARLAYQTTSADRAELRNSLNITSTAKVIGYIGSIERYEGLQILAKAAAELIAESHEVYLLIVGGGHFSSQLHEVCCNLGIISNVRLTGELPQNKAVRYYSAIDICVYPRLADKVCEIVPPLKPLEAALLGIPVISSNIKPIAELVADMDNINLVEPNDHAALKNQLLPLLVKKDKSFLDSIKPISQRTWKNSARAYLSVLPRVNE